MSQRIQIFAVYDKKALCYMQPHFAVQKGQAIRAFQDVVNSESMFNKHPEDFVLYHIGEYDEASGLISGLNAPVHIEEAMTLKNVAQK